MANTGNAGTLVSLAYNAEQIDKYLITVEAAVPWLAIIMFAVDILELAGIIPDPIALLIGAFTGRPREQATVQQAGRLMSARNPAARQAGIMLERMVKEWNIVTSEAGQGRTILDSWANLFVNNLTAQGITLDRARQILVNATSEAAQSGLELEPELKQPLPDPLVFNGPQSMLDTLTQQYQNWIAKGVTIKQALQHAENYIFTKYGLRYLFQLQIGTYIPPTPPPQTVIPSQDGSCPAGYSLDPGSKMCVLPSQGGNGGGGGGGGNTQPDPEGDEITNDLCAQMGAYTAALCGALQGLNPGSGSGTDPECCANVVNALANVTTTLTSIAAAIGSAASGSGASVDLSGITAALNNLVNAVGSIPGGTPVDLAPIVEALNNIATKIPGAGATDVSGIVQKLQMLFDTIDVPMPIYQSLVDDGYLDSADLQLLNPGPFGAGLIKLAEKYGEKALLKLSHVLGIDWVNGVPQLTDTATKIMDTIFRVVGAVLTAERNAVEGLITPILAKMNSALQPSGTPNLGNVFVDPDQVLADVATVTLNGLLLATIVGAIREGAGEPIERWSELFGGLLGLEEMREVQIGPKIRFGIGAVADIAAKALYQQSLPGAGQAADWRARGLIAQTNADTLFRFNGFNADIQKWTEAAAYTGINARMLLQVVQSGLVTQGDLADELTFSGVRPASQQRLLAVAPWIATRAERDQLKASLEKAYTQGLLDDAGLHAQLDQIQQETDRDALILARAQLEKRIAMAKGLEAAYSTEFRAGVIVEAQYRSLLDGIGLQPDWINYKVAIDDAHLLATLARQAAAAERALERATAAEERKAAMKNFTTGHLDPVSLAAALVLTGLTATQAAAWVDLAVLEKAGGLRWQYGLQLPAAEASLLRSRVSALSDQRKRLQITDLAFTAALQALGIPPKYVNTIKAAADAMITPKASAVTIPVETG